jgi:hypothetical protein
MARVDRFATQREQLTALEGQLADLQARYELAMSGFKFDEANAVQREISALEAQRRALAAVLPTPAAAPEPPVGIVPAVGRPRRLRVRRPRSA